jgi:hypothetical protein
MVPELGGSIFRSRRPVFLEQLNQYWEVARNPENKYGTLGFLFRYTLTEPRIMESYTSKQFINKTSPSSHIAINRGLQTIQWEAKGCNRFRTCLAQKNTVPGKLDYTALAPDFELELMKKTAPMLFNGTNWVDIDIDQTSIAEGNLIAITDVVVSHEIAGAERTTPLSLMLASRLFAPTEIFAINKEHVLPEYQQVLAANQTSQLPPQINGFFPMADAPNAHLPPVSAAAPPLRDPFYRPSAAAPPEPRPPMRGWEPEPPSGATPAPPYGPPGWTPPRRDGDDESGD